MGMKRIDLVISHEFPYGSYKKEFGRGDKQALLWDGDTLSLLDCTKRAHDNE